MKYTMRKDGKVLFHLFIEKYWDENARIRFDVQSNVPQIILFLEMEKQFYLLWNTIYLSGHRAEELLEQMAKAVVNSQLANNFFYPEYIIETEVDEINLTTLHNWKYYLEFHSGMYFSPKDNQWGFYFLSVRFILIQLLFLEYLHQDVKQIESRKFEMNLCSAKMMLAYIDVKQPQGNYWLIHHDGMNFFFYTNEENNPLFVYIS